jgi:hypothetical protein
VSDSRGTARASGAAARLAAYGGTRVCGEPKASAARLLTLLLAGLIFAAPAVRAVPVGGTANERGDLSPGAAPSLDERIRASCPGAVASQLRAHEREARHRPAPVTQVTRPALRRELLLRGQLDQQVREFAMGASELPSASDPRIARMQETDADNLQRLHHIVRQDGFPTARMVGYDGVAAAWLILQHASADPAFQAALLPTIEGLARRGELSGENYALLADRVLLAQGKRQRFGTQFTGFGPALQLQPLEDPQRVDQRRAQLGLMSLEDYQCLLRVVYGGAGN